MNGGSGVVPAVTSLIIPGVGQLLNGETDKALGVFVVSVVTGAGFLGSASRSSVASFGLVRAVRTCMRSATPTIPGPQEAG